MTGSTSSSRPSAEPPRGGTGHIDEGLTLDRRGRVEVYPSANSVGCTIGHSGDHHAALAVTHQDHIFQILELKHGNDVTYVHVEVHVGTEQVGAFD